MGGHDSYRDTFTSWAVTPRETKGEGSDLAKAKARFIYTMGGSGHVCKNASRAGLGTKFGPGNFLMDWPTTGRART